jgi:hypothetical protein
MVSRDPLDDLRRALPEFQPDVVGVSVRNIDNVVAQRVSWHLGELDAVLATVRANTAARIVLGDPAISILGAAALERLDGDFAYNLGSRKASGKVLLTAPSG